MSDIVKLFDGTLGAGGSPAVDEQYHQGISDVSSEADYVARLSSGSDSIPLLVDYSDFANFVTFNSAESYVTVTADQILNEYPTGGTVDDLQTFIDSLDGYQQFFLRGWPSRTGHLRFNPGASSSFVVATDFGTQDGVSRTSFISPGTGSLSIQCWIDVPTLTGTNDATVVFQKLGSNALDGTTVYCSGSSLLFSVVSGSTSVSVSSTLPSGPSFFSAVVDRSAATGTVSLYVGTTGTFPVLAGSTQAVFGSRFDLGSGSFSLGSGSLSGKSVVPFTGSIDSFSVWSTPRTAVAVSSSYNRKLYAQSGLLLLWRFNDATELSPPSMGSIIRDSSGHRLDGRVQRYFPGIRGSGSIDFDWPDPIISLDDPSVVSYIIDAQVSGAAYDRTNQSLVFNLFPELFSTGDPTSTDVFKNFSLILARHFDLIKSYIDQFVRLRRVKYGDLDQSPDELLPQIAQYMGFKLGGSFATTDALRYFVSRQVLPGPDGNRSLDTSVAQIKAQFWRRVLLNLMYIYKTKGTRESVEALLRVYGVDNGFVRLKEYSRRSEVRPTLERVIAEKSVYTLMFRGGSRVSFSRVAVTASLPTLVSISVSPSPGVIDFK